MARHRLRRYRITLEDTSSLHRIITLRISRWRLALTAILVCALCAGIGALIVVLTPVKRSVPGFMTGSDRDATMAVLMRIDSLSTVLLTNQAYIDNLSDLLADARPVTDSLGTTPLTPLPLDSLHAPSKREQEFVSTIDERERYNLNVLSPIAAEGIIFSSPSNGGIVAAESAHSRLLKVILPAGQGVNAIIDGRVIDRGYDPVDGSYTLLVQGGRGFLVRYSHLATPLVDTGDAITSGQCLSVEDGKKKSHTRYIGIEMWREGTPLIPGDYLYKPKREAPTPIEAPRGKE